MKKGLLGGALLFLGGGAWVALRGGRKEPLPPEGLRLLSVTEYSVVVAVARRILPRGAPWPDPDALGVAKICDGLIADLDETTQLQLRQLFNLFESGLTSLFSGVSAAPFTLLSGEEQDAVLDNWATSRLMLKRAGYQAMRRLTTAAYFGKKETWAAIGYPGPPPVNDPNAPVWKGGDVPRPEGLGVWHEPEAKP